jgi:27-O-demethylrifamycin SV methyltransferase
LTITEKTVQFIQRQEQILKPIDMSQLNERIRSYYEITTPGYKNWGTLPEKEGIYALHYGYYSEKEETTHHQSLRNMTQKIIEVAQIASGQVILDTGCGVGEIAFEIAARYPQAQVVGITLLNQQANTAQRYRENMQVKNAHFSVQDFSFTGFPRNTFDRVIFCESFCYALGKRSILNEVVRVMHRGGLLTIADGFFTRKNLDEDKQVYYEAIKKGWAIPNFIPIDDFSEYLTDAGFKNISLGNITRNILPSSELMMQNAVYKIKVEPEMPELVRLNREACIAQHALATSEILGYYLISAELG